MTSTIPQAYSALPLSFSQSYPVYGVFPNQNASPYFLGSSAARSLSFGTLPNSHVLGSPTGSTGLQNSRQKLDSKSWRNILNLNVDELFARGDVETIESHLATFTSPKIRKEDLQRLSDEDLLNLLRLSQYGIEYLISSREQVANQSQLFYSQAKLFEEKLKPLAEQAKQNDDEISLLKKEIKRQEKLLKNYKESHTEVVYRCHICAKSFKTEDYLDLHIKRRHDPDHTLHVLEVSSGNPVEKEVFSKSPTTAASTDDKSLDLERSLVMAISKMNQDKDARYSQLVVSLEKQLDQVVQTNRNLTAKVEEMEKKLHNKTPLPHSHSSPNLKKKPEILINANSQLQVIRENVYGDSNEDSHEQPRNAKPAKLRTEEKAKTAAPTGMALGALPWMLGGAMGTPLVAALGGGMGAPLGGLSKQKEVIKSKKQVFKAGNLEDDMRYEQDAVVGQMTNLINSQPSSVRNVQNRWKAGEIEDDFY